MAIEEYEEIEERVEEKDSDRHEEEHPSPSRLLPSSHSSSQSILLFGHRVHTLEETRVAHEQL